MRLPTRAERGISSLALARCRGPPSGFVGPPRPHLQDSDSERHSRSQCLNCSPPARIPSRRPSVARSTRPSARLPHSRSVLRPPRYQTSILHRGTSADSSQDTRHGRPVRAVRDILQDGSRRLQSGRVGRQHERPFEVGLVRVEHIIDHGNRYSILLVRAGLASPREGCAYRAERPRGVCGRKRRPIAPARARAFIGVAPINAAGRSVVYGCRPLDSGFLSQAIQQGV